MKNIVVGVDGSTGSVEALRWAVGEAELHDATVTAVCAWEFPYMYGEGAALLSLDAIEADTRIRLEQTIEDAIVDPVQRARIERKLVSGHPSVVMELESEKADLLVVGARGHGGFVGLLLGSVSDQVVKHAHCPVVVVRHATSK
jgi:nucleotide-binding universal stress UspA family protein